MATNFKPPPVKKLATVDLADCEYASALTEVVGVVSFGGQGGWPATENYEVHCFAFAAWRRVGQPLIEKELTILRPVAPKSDRFSEYPAGTIHKVRVLLSVDETRAVFATPIEADVVDTELQAVATALQKPVTITTERYGVLTLDRRIHWFEGTATWNGVPVDISFETDVDHLNITTQLKTADTLFASAAEWGKKVNDFAVKEKLELANEWRDGGVKPISAKGFLRRMKLKSISIKRDGQFEFWHHDGDLFCGHSIQISGSLKNGLTHSDISG